jgi:hypothetical protein
MRGTSEPDQLQVLAQAVQAMAPNLDALQSGTIYRAIPSVLGWAGTADEATAWASALISVLPREPPRNRIVVISEALKYPTSAGTATAVLLNGLRRIGAPGEDAGLDANLTWIRTTYPEIDAPPVCPTPPPARQGLTCPSIKCRSDGECSRQW